MGIRSKRFDKDDHAAILLDQAKQRLEAKKKQTYSAAWLIEGGIGSDHWLTSVPGKNKTAGFSFNRTMADGTNLCAPENKLLLEAIQKWAFDLRMGAISGSQITPEGWTNHLQNAVKTASWVCMYRKRFDPDHYAFSHITAEDCKSLLNDLSSGGWIKALKYKERLIIFFHTQTNSTVSINELLNSPDSLDEEFKQAVVNWITENNLYSKIGKQTLGLSRSFLAQQLGITASGRSRNFTVFLRQFEAHLNSDVVKPLLRMSRVPSKNMTAMSEHPLEGVSEMTFSGDLASLKKLFQGHVRYNLLFPDIDLNIKEIKATFANTLNKGLHTPLIPLTIGLDALNQAIQWIVEFGPAIVDAIVFYTKKFNDNHSKSFRYWKIARKNKLLQDTIQQWQYLDIELNKARSLKSAINITSIGTREWRPVTKTECDFYSVVQAFIGACVVVIGMLKPMRDQEITRLPRDCLSIEDDIQGARLLHEQEKSGNIGINNWITRAIPSITARAIQLLQVLGEQLSAIFEDTSPHSSDLFYFPSVGLTRPGSKAMRARINDCLDKFCDMIEVPLDTKGRRWYIRIHEMRKFFILVTHRHGGDNIIDALRYQAGQKDRRHIYSYIAPDAYDDLYVRYETECVEDKLIALENGAIKKDANPGLVALYEDARKHFGATSLSGVTSADFFALLLELRTSGQYEVSVYSVLLDDFTNPVECLDFAIKYRDIKDEKYDE